MFTYFSDAQLLQSYIDNGESIDIVLISPDLYTAEMKLPDDVLIVLLEDDALSMRTDSVLTVYRYQRLGQLITTVMGYYYEHNETAGRQFVRSKHASVISVFSPMGGVGKTTVAVNLCKQLALNGERVFYLNLETIPSGSLFFSSEEDNPSLQIFYYAKQETGQLLSKIEALKKYDPYSMVDYFDIAIQAAEMLELKEMEIKRLINGIVDTGVYDYIIIDLDSSLHERSKVALLESDQVFWINTNDHQSMLKTKAILAEEEQLFGKENVLKDKLSIILNKYNGTSLLDLGETEITIDGYLPFVDDWLSIQSGAEILRNDLFNQEMQQIVYHLLLKMKEGVQVREI